MSRWRAALGLVLAAWGGAGCGGDAARVYFADVSLTPTPACTQTGLPMQSIEVDVLHDTAEGLRELGDTRDCHALGPTHRIEDVLAPFAAAGVVVEGVPADEPTVLRLVAYARANCLTPFYVACGITCPPIKAGTIPEAGVTLNLVCRTQPLFEGCLNLEALDAEGRATLCSRASP